MSLLQETIDILKDHSKTYKDVLWVGSDVYGYISWKEYKKIANKEYKIKGVGPKVASDLLVVGKDFWLERREGDGKEYWVYQTAPEKPIIHYPIHRVIGEGDILFESLAEMNR